MEKVLCFSKNSLDENTMAPGQNLSFDEQEMSVDMLNDETDHYNKMYASNKAASDLCLKATLGNHNDGTKPVTNGKIRHAPQPPVRPLDIGNATSSNLGNASNDNHSNIVHHLYDNHGFEMQATEI